MQTERFELRLDPQLLKQIDEWRSTQSGVPSRADAVRRLVQTGLAVNAGDQLAFGPGEKMILFMLCQLIRQQGSDGDINPKFVEEALACGHHWALDWQYPGIFDARPDPLELVEEVVDVLEMWTALERSYEQLEEADKALVATEAEPFGNDVKFMGFCGNEESRHLGIAHFLTRKLERFPWFRERELNSHMPSIGSYRRMLSIYRPIRQRTLGRDLSASEIIALLREEVHPDNR